MCYCLTQLAKGVYMKRFLKFGLTFLVAFLLMVPVIASSANSATVWRATVTDGDTNLGLFFYFTADVPRQNVTQLNSFITTIAQSYAPGAIQNKQIFTNPGTINSEVNSLFQSSLPHGWDAYLAGLTYGSNYGNLSTFRTDYFVNPGSSSYDSVIDSGFNYLASFETTQQIVNSILSMLPTGY